ncbi:hypothetical protein MAR_020073 [Mya arenaria]|uniref:Uncharacterized protein n=1 Tax=Mya arenaria TaxID=6604 RepID=A0ABY7E6D1_MYAAR|nr:hypothetical protein MAR_020073 [Mya arenaria]
MQSCKECPSINQCKLRNCTKSTDVYCKQCNDLFFKLYNSNKECQRANNTFTTYQQFQDINSSQSVKISQHDVDNLMLTEDKYTLENGQASYKTKTVLFSYMIDVQQETCRRDAKESCYCPDIRNCEIYKYSIVMLEYEIHFKDIVIHNNETYTFSVTVINNAGLATVKYINVLVDKTPPEVGKAYKEYRERNDTNGKLDVYWQGFNDEESGLGQYRLGVATRCLSKEELYDMSLANGSTVYIDVPSNETSAEIFDTFNCTSYVSIIAINNADEPSSVVCIDGIAKPDRDECTGTHGIQTFVAVYWQDFNDKESGLRQYRLGVATRCFTKEELYDRSLANGSTIYIDVPSNETSAEIFDTFNCTSYVSIIAINNIDEPSSVVCIEGIAKPDRDECTDKTPPDVGNVHKEQHERNGTHGIQTYVAVYWQGFNDEESGLGQYRLGVATRCLTKEELYDRSLANDSTVYTDVPSNETSAEIFDTFNCTSYVSIIAINNVDEPSSVVCIEGIGKPYRTECTEKTPPDVGKRRQILPIWISLKGWDKAGESRILQDRSCFIRKAWGDERFDLREP